MDLTQALPAMSWRRFFVLLSGLPPHSAYVQSMAHKQREAEQVISDPDEAERYVASMMG